MRRHLNTLYVTTENAWLRKDGENVVVQVDKKEQGRVPVHLLGGIVCFGAVGVTPALMGHCATRGVCMSILSRNGRFLARIEGPVSGNVLLRRAQYRTTDDTDRTARLASHLVTGKLLNQRTVVRRALRDHGTSTSAEARGRLDACERRLSDAARRVGRAAGTDVIRGIEGEAGPKLLRGVRRPDARRGPGIHLPGPVAPTAARSSERPPVIPVYATGSRLSVSPGNCRPRSSRGIPAP